MRHGGGAGAGATAGARLALVQLSAVWHVTMAQHSAFAPHPESRTSAWVGTSPAEKSSAMMIAMQSASDVQADMTALPSREASFGQGSGGNTHVINAAPSVVAIRADVMSLGLAPATKTQSAVVQVSPWVPSAFMVTTHCMEHATLSQSVGAARHTDGERMQRGWRVDQSTHGGAPQLAMLDIMAARQSGAAKQASCSAEQSGWASCRKRCAYDASAVASRPVASTSFWVKVIFCKVRKTAGQLSTSSRAGLWRGDQALLAADAGETRRSSVCIAQAATPPTPRPATPPQARVAPPGRWALDARAVVSA